MVKTFVRLFVQSHIMFLVVDSYDIIRSIVMSSSLTISVNCPRCKEWPRMISFRQELIEIHWINALPIRTLLSFLFHRTIISYDPIAIKFRYRWRHFEPCTRCNFRGWLSSYEQIISRYWGFRKTREIVYLVRDAVLTLIELPIIQSVHIVSLHFYSQVSWFCRSSDYIVISHRFYVSKLSALVKPL